MVKTKSGKSLDINKFKEVGAGGEGKIVEVSKDRVAKIYHQPRKKTFSKHLESLATLSDTFIKPVDIYFSTNTKEDVIGFEMKYVNMNDFFLFNNLFNKGFCSSNNVKKDFKINLLQHLRKALEELHTLNIQFGDCNPYNIMFNLKGQLVIVDVDSFQTPTQSHSMTLLQEIQDFSTTAVTKETDIWAYDILSFWATTYMHPFKWVAPGNKDTFEQRVRQGKSILTKIPNVKIPPIYEAPQGEIDKQYREIFNGRRYFVDFSGNIISPVNVVIKQQISSTALTIRELFSNVTQVNVCGDYIGVKHNGKWASVETKIPKVTRTIGDTSADGLYPTNNGKEVIVDTNRLKGQTGEIEFVQPEFFYYNGYLTVIDYATDLQYNFNLNNQLGGIEHTQTPVFAKSIVVRNTPIQNFGGKKYINIPYYSKYQLFEVPLGTKNAIYSEGFVAVEYTEGNMVKYRIGTGGIKIGMDMDYLPAIASKGKALFVPEDGSIDVYIDYACVQKLDASMCTRQSKLYSCNSGILLLENNILYLLNTK